jgi:hypothetical protein
MKSSVKGMMDVYYSFKNFHELSLIYHKKIKGALIFAKEM